MEGLSKGAVRMRVRVQCVRSDELAFASTSRGLEKKVGGLVGTQVGGGSR